MFYVSNGTSFAFSSSSIYCFLRFSSCFFSRSLLFSLLLRAYVCLSFYYCLTACKALLCQTLSVWYSPYSSIYGYYLINLLRGLLRAYLYRNYGVDFYFANPRMVSRVFLLLLVMVVVRAILVSVSVSV